MAAATADKKILEYMTAQNRPYSATDVLMNLHKEIGYKESGVPLLFWPPYREGVR